MKTNEIARRPSEQAPYRPFAGILLVICGFALQAWPVNASDLSAEIEPLKKPDLASAKIAIGNLTRLSSEQKGVEKAKTDHLLALVKNLFTAEFRVSEAIKGCDKAEVEAVRNEVIARDWMTPNAFGKVNESGAGAAIARAKEIREKAAQKVLEKQGELATQLQEADSLLHDFYKNEEFGVVLTLAETVRVINERSMPQDMFKPSFSRDSMASIRELFQSKDEWMLAAKNAEEAENYQEAIRYYSKARSQAGRKRCAKNLAQNLENSKVYGSAIDYYEMAGDYKTAAALRRQHPELGLGDYKKLDSEDLFAKVSPSCVRILNGNSLGSGFFFKLGGYILTNRHVVDSAGPITVKMDDGRSLEAKMIEKSKNLDIAIIKVQLSEHSFISFRGAEEVRIGLPVTIIGYPEKDLPTATMNTGRVSNTDRSFQGNPVYQLDATANHGNSGGPVVDDSGCLVGIITFSLLNSNIDRFNFAIRSDAILEFVKKAIPEY